MRALTPSPRRRAFAATPTPLAPRQAGSGRDHRHGHRPNRRRPDPQRQRHRRRDDARARGAATDGQYTIADVPAGTHRVSQPRASATRRSTSTSISPPADRDGQHRAVRGDRHARPDGRRRLRHAAAFGSHRRQSHRSHRMSNRRRCCRSSRRCKVRRPA